VSLAQHPQPVFGYRKPFTHPPRGMRFPFQRRVDRVHKKEKFPKENEALSAPLERKDPDERAGFLSASHRSNSKSLPFGFLAPRSCLLFGWRLCHTLTPSSVRRLRASEYTVPTPPPSARSGNSLACANTARSRLRFLFLITLLQRFKYLLRSRSLVLWSSAHITALPPLVAGSLVTWPP